MEEEKDQNKIDFKALEDAEPSPGQPLPEFRKLERSKNDFILAGVCGGLANYLRIDPGILRIILVLSMFLGGWGIVVYIITVFLIPPEKKPIELPNAEKQKIRKTNNRTLLGSILLFLGLYILFSNFGFIIYLSPFNLSWNFIIPLFALLISLYLVVNRQYVEDRSDASAPKHLTRSMTDKRLLGVCGGIADYLNVDSAIVRVIWVIASYITAGTGVLVYVLFVFILKNKEELNEGTVS